MLVEEILQEPDEEWEILCHGVLEVLIPRLLRPLESGVRAIRRLIHGIIWVDNVSTNIHTMTPVLCNRSCLYAHNALEMAANTTTNRSTVYECLLQLSPNLYA